MCACNASASKTSFSNSLANLPFPIRLLFQRDTCMESLVLPLMENHTELSIGKTVALI